MILHLLLGGKLLAERCHTDDLMPSRPIPVLCLPPSHVDPKVLGPNVLVYHSQLILHAGIQSAKNVKTNKLPCSVVEKSGSFWSLSTLAYQGMGTGQIGRSLPQ